MIMDSFELIEGFRTKWPFAPRYARVNGWRMHYVDEGAGDPILLLHGNPTWGFLYRDVIPPLVNAGRPDDGALVSSRRAGTIAGLLACRWLYAHRADGRCLGPSS